MQIKKKANEMHYFSSLFW